MRSSEPVVETKDLTKKYGKFVALDGLTMAIERGQILGFVGPNGVGKTTTIKILVGLARPTSGSATVAGADCVTEARRLKRLVDDHDLPWNYAPLHGHLRQAESEGRFSPPQAKTM